MKLRELVLLLQAHLDRHPNEDENIAISLKEPSIGPSASTSINHVCGGFDWDRGTVFLIPAKPLIHGTKLEYEALKQSAKKQAAWYKEHDWLDRRREHCYEQGFIDGAKFGSFHLIEAQVQQQGGSKNES